MHPIKQLNISFFFYQIKHELVNCATNDDSKIVVGGDFNVELDPNFDGQGGKQTLKESAKHIEDIWSSQT